MPSAAIFLLALVPIPPTQAIPGTDKFHHLVAFGALTMPCALLYPRVLLWVLPAIVLQMGLIELLQPLVNRHREWADILAGLKGLVLGLAAGLVLRVAVAAFTRTGSR